MDERIIKQKKYLDKIHHRNEIIENIQYQMVHLLNEIKFEKWWEETSFFNETHCQKLLVLTGSNEEFNIKEVKQLVNQIIAQINGVQSSIRELSGDKIANIIVTHEMAVLSSDPQLLRILSGQAVRKVKDSTYINLLRYFYWKATQSSILTIGKAFRIINNKPFEKIKTEEINPENPEPAIEVLLRNFQNAEDKYREGEALLSSLDNASALGFNTNEIRAALYRQRHTITQECNMEELVFQIMSDAVIAAEQQLAGNLQTSSLLWVVLNSELLPKDIKKRCIEIVSNSPLRRACQNGYDSFLMHNPNAEQIQFSRNYHHRPNLILPKDFMEGGEPINGMGLILTHSQVVNLYQNLLSSSFIANDTDIQNFSYALTGYPLRKEYSFVPVNWVGGKKQSLAIFLGCLRDSKKSGKWYWNKSTELFRFKGDRFSATQLSSPFGKFISHPETRGKDWDIINRILSVSLKSK